MTTNKAYLQAAAEVIRAGLGIKASNMATKMVYLYIMEHRITKEKVPSVENIATRLGMKEANVQLAIAELLSLKLCFGNSNRFDVVLPEIEEKENKLMAIVRKQKSPSPLDLLNDYYAKRTAAAGPKQQVKTPNDFALMRHLCLKFSPEIVAGRIAAYFEKGLYKEEAKVTVRSFASYVATREEQAKARAEREAAKGTEKKPAKKAAAKKHDVAPEVAAEAAESTSE